MSEISINAPIITRESIIERFLMGSLISGGLYLRLRSDIMT